MTGTLKVYVRDCEDETVGTLLGAFPPSEIPHLLHLLGRVEVIVSDQGEGVDFVADAPPMDDVEGRLVVDQRGVRFDVTF